MPPLGGRRCNEGRGLQRPPYYPKLPAMVQHASRPGDGLESEEGPSFGLQCVSSSQAERSFDRHFAATQMKSDVFGNALGSVIYLSLIPSLAPLGRPDLVLAAVGCAAVCTWPYFLSRYARGLYVARRDYILMLHFLFHYAIGGQLGRFVRLHQKFAGASPVAFVLGFVFSSTVLWQSLDALMYRMRFWRFMLTKPLILLANLPLEQRLCQLSCAEAPADARYFHLAADFLSLLLSPFRLLPLPTTSHAAAATGGADVVTSCVKVQAWLLVVLCWLLPGYLLYRLEKQLTQQFQLQSGALVVPDSEAAADAALLQQAAAAQARASGKAGLAGGGKGAAADGTLGWQPPSNGSSPSALKGESSEEATAAQRLAADQLQQPRWEGGLQDEDEEDEEGMLVLQRFEARRAELWQRWWEHKVKLRCRQGTPFPLDELPDEPAFVRWVRAATVASLVWHVLDAVLA